MNVFAGIAACFHTVKTFSNFELNYVHLIGPFNANACFAFIKHLHTVFLQRLSVLRTLYGNATGTFYDKDRTCIQKKLCKLHVHEDIT